MKENEEEKLVKNNSLKRSWSLKLVVQRFNGLKEYKTNYIPKYKNSKTHCNQGVKN